MSSCGGNCSPCSRANATAACVPSGGSCACSYTCNTGFHDCGGTCVADTSTCSATSCTVCTAPANATPACAGASCDFTCEAGYVRCGGACFPAAQGCPPPAGSCAYRMEWYNNRDSAVGGISVAGVTGNVSQAFFLYATSYLGHTAWVFEVSQAPVGGACPNNGGGVIWSVTCPSASGSSTYRGENGAIYTCDAYGALAIRPINPY